MRATTLFLASMLAACGPPPADSGTNTGTATGGGTPGATPGGTAGGTPTGTTGGTTTGSTSGIAIDCDNLPAPGQAGLVQNARGYHGLVLDTNDDLVGSDGTNLVAVDSTGAGGVFAPNTGNYEQMAMLPNGDIAAAHIDTQSVQIITPGGSVTNLAQNIGAYGLEIGPDGMIYTANPSNDIKRIDPATGAVETFIPGNGTSPKVMAWSPDLDRFYYGTLGSTIYAVDLDANYDPIGSPTVFVNNIGGWHDGLDTDICGNLYLADFVDSALYKITPTGQVSLFLDPPQTNYGHGIEFGEDRGGWSAMSIYQPMPYNGNTVSTVDIGVPHRTWTGGTVINGP